MKRLLLFYLLGILLAGCQAPPPRVVTIVVPYVPILHLDATNFKWLGAASCDVQGQPVIWIHPALRDEMVPWVLTHERIHVEQMKAYGGCVAFDRRVQSDSMFRLRVEAESYCGVYLGQRRVHIPPNPSYPSIVRQLLEDYGHKYDRDSVIAAMPC